MRRSRHLSSVRGSQAGFTLVELLAVVAMIGILSVVAMVGYQRYLNSARTADAKAIMGSIGVAQESHRAETLSYLGCSANLTDYYPMATPNGKRRNWNNPGHPDNLCWRTLNVAVDSPTTFVFATVTGGPGDAVPAPNTAQAINFPAPTEPWYVVQAIGDEDADGAYVTMVSSSFGGGVYVEDEGE